MVWLDLIYPRKCFGCHKPGGYFCERCLNKIELTPTKSFLFDVHFGLDGLVSLFSYRGLLRLGIHKLKYRFLTDSQKDWQRLIRVALGQKLTAESGWRLKHFLLTNPVVIPVPLYWRRLNWRGFNQAEILAKMVAENLKLGLAPHLVKRIQPSHPQVGLSRFQRQKNVAQAFRVQGPAPQKALIIDDVWTSGATMIAVAKALRRAGAKTVWGLTLAR